MPTLREMFAHHHRLSDAERAVLWRECHFALDTNVLLNIYRYARETREDLFSVLGALKGRLWVPHTAGSEFYRNRLQVIQEQKSKFTNLSENLDGALRMLADATYKKSGFLKLEKLEAILNPAVAEAKGQLERDRASHPDLLREDPYLEELVQVLGDAVLAPPSKDSLVSRHKLAQERIERSDPPGYRDAKKPIPDRYGDVLIWFELLDLAERVKHPIVFVTDDDKDDWWQIFQGEKLGARPELRAEMSARAGVDFYICKPAYLLESVGARLDIKVAPSSIDDARNIAAEAQEVADELAHGVLRPQAEASASYRQDPPHFSQMAEHAVGMWLAAQYPNANIAYNHTGFDFLVSGPNDRLGVEVRAIRTRALIHLTRRLQDASLRSYYELSEKHLDRFLLVLVASSLNEAAIMADRVLEKPHLRGNMSVSIGHLPSPQTYQELWRVQ